MKPVKLILVHGLPGAGKTTLCRSAAERFKRLGYVNLAVHPQFGTLSMADICAEMAGDLVDVDIIITEGMLSKVSQRDRFMQTAISKICDRGHFSDVEGAIVFLDENPENLVQRRARSIEDYLALKEAVETGSHRFQYVRFESAGDDVEARVKKFGSLLEKLTPSWKEEGRF